MPGEEGAFWNHPEPGRLVGRGHAAGDILEAYLWEVKEARDGYLRVGAHLPEHLLNLQGQLFGGFTPTYAELLAVHTWWAGRRATPGRPWLATLNLRVDYFEPIVESHFEMVGRVIRRRGQLSWIECQFLSPEGEVCVHAYVSLKAIPQDQKGAS